MARAPTSARQGWDPCGGLPTTQLAIGLLSAQGHRAGAEGPSSASRTLPCLSGRERPCPEALACHFLRG